MAPSGGSPSLGTPAHEANDFLAITADDILNWTPQRLRRQCFQFGLVSEAPEGDVATLRTVFLKHWRAAVAAATGAATQETEADGAGAASASESLPRSPGGQFVTPPASPQATGAPSAPSVPFQDGVFSRPERDTDPVPWALDPENFATVDAMDSLAEGMFLTPGRDPYASARGASPDEATDDGGAGYVPRPRSTPLGPSMARNLFGTRPRGTPRRPDTLHGGRDGKASPESDHGTADAMEAETASEGGDRARALKRRTKDRSPQGTPRRWAAGRPNLGPTPLKIRELPSAPHGARETGNLADDDSTLRHSEAPFPSEGAGAQTHTDRYPARDAVDNTAPDNEPPTTELPPPPRSRSVSPRADGGAPNANAAHQEHPAESEDDTLQMCGAYARLTPQCWAKLVRLSERPDERELLDLQAKSLQALVKAVGGTYGNDWRKPRLALRLLQWMEQHPDQALPLPLGRLRENRQRHQHHASDQQTRPNAAEDPRQQGRSAAQQNASRGDGRESAAPHNTADGPRQEQPDAPMTDARGSNGTTHAGSSAHADGGDRREQSHQRTGAAPEVQQAAEALRASSKAILATMDAVAELFERARRGEECTEVEGEQVAAMVEESRATLRGVVAGFAAADLLAALNQAPETERRPPMDKPPRGPGGRTYAQAVNTAQHPPDGRTQRPTRPSPTAPWAPERTALLHPTDARQRQAPTRASEFGAELDRKLRSDLGIATGPAVELVRRTAKGEYAVQFAMPAWERLQTDRSITLPTFGRWSRRVADRARRPRDSVVLQGVPKTMTPDQVVRDLLHGNGDRWKALPGADLDDVRVERLNRRVPAPATAGDGQDSRPRAQWLPSATVRVFASAALCTAVLKEGGAVVGYSFRPARPYERAPIRCYRCGEMGFHVGKFCRNKPRCRHCGRGHETSGCPDKGAAHPQENPAGGPRRGAARTL